MFCMCRLNIICIQKGCIAVVDKDLENYKIIKNNLGKEYVIFDVFYNGGTANRKKRFYGETKSEVQEKVQVFIADALDSYSQTFPNEYTVPNIVNFFLRGIELFHRNVNDEFIIGETQFTPKDVIHLKYVCENIIVSYGFNHNISEVTQKQYEDFLKLVTNFYDYETLQEICFLLKNACILAKRNNIATIDFDTVTVPRKYSGVIRPINGAVNNSSFNYFYNSREYNLLLDYCLKVNIGEGLNLYKSHMDIIGLILMTGIEFKEIIGLPYSRVNLEKKELQLDNRTIPLDERACTFFGTSEFVTGMSYPESDKRFGITRNGSIVDISNVNVRLRKLEHFLAIPQVTLKALTRSYVIFKLNEGVPERELSKWLTPSTVKEFYEIKRLYLDFKNSDCKIR